MSFIFAADLHMSAKTFVNSPVNYDSVNSLDCLFSLSKHLTKEQKLSYYVPLVLGGDVWDSVKVSPDVLLKAATVRAKYPEVPVYYINGNHDPTEPSWTSFLGEATPLGKEVQVLPDGTRLVGMPWQLVSKIPDYLRETDPTADFLVVHQFIEPSNASQEASDAFESIVPGSIPSNTFEGFNAVLAGDIHKTQIYPNSVPPLAYPSCTNLRNLKEVPGCFLVSLDPNEFPVSFGGHSLKPVALPGRSVKHLSFETSVVPDTLEAVTAAVNNLLSEPQESWPKEFEASKWHNVPYVVIHAPFVDPRCIQKLAEHFNERAIILSRTQSVEASESDELKDSDGLPAQSTLDYALMCLAEETLPERLKEKAALLLQNEDLFLSAVRTELNL